MSTTSRTPAPTPGSDEAYVREVLDAAMTDSPPPLGLPATALARGRRLRNRRRAGTAAVSLAAAVVTGVVLPWGAGDGGGRAGGSDLVATQPAAPEPDLATAPPGFWDMPTRSMVQALTERLPEGRILSGTGPLVADSAQGGPGRGFVNSTLAFSWAGEIVEGNVSLMLWPRRSTTLPDAQGDDGDTLTIGLQDDLLVCPNGQPTVLTCEELTDDNGRPVARRLTSRLGDLHVLEFTLLVGDGVVYGATANTDDEKWGEESEITAPRPPLALGELEELVRDPVWTSYRP